MFTIVGRARAKTRYHISPLLLSLSLKVIKEKSSDLCFPHPHPLFFLPLLTFIKYYSMSGTTLSITSFNPHLNSVREPPLLSTMGINDVIESLEVSDWWGWTQGSRTGRHASYPTMPQVASPV